MKHVRFTCKTCGLIINKNEYQGDMSCPQNHGIMHRKEWRDSTFYLMIATPVIVALILLFVLM